MDDAAAHALLDVLDPVRSRAFRAHYVGLPLDLSAVIFALCRRAARRIAEGCRAAPGALGPEALAEWYGKPPYRGDDVANRTRRPGVAVGLATTIAPGARCCSSRRARSPAAAGCA